MKMLELGRSLGILGLAALCMPAPVAIQAQVAPDASTAIIDGTPTAESCARYGFGAPEDDDRRSDYYPAGNGLPRRAGPAHVKAHISPSPVTTSQGLAPPPPPPPPPAPPPPPSPMMAPQSLVVTGARIPGQPGIYGPPGPPAGAVDTERYPNAAINAVKRVAEQPVSTFSIDVDTASYANVRRFLKEGTLPPRESVRVEEMVNYFDYAYPRPESAQTPFRPFVAVTPSPWSPDKKIIHIGLQGYDLPRREQPPLNLVFLVDVSGSMWTEDRLPLAVKSLNVLVDQLRPQDQVSLVVYAGAAGAVLQPTPGYEKLKIRCALGALKAGGSTAGGQGLELAYDMALRHFDKGAVNRVILMTDGDFNVGVADPSRLQDFVEEKRKTGVYLSVYGFGRGNYNDLMMQTLAQNGNGTAAYIDEVDEARKLFRTDFPSSLFPIADDVKIQVEFNPARVSEYRLIGYETRLLNREDFNNDKVDAGEVGAGASVTALYEITPVGGSASVDPLRYQQRAAAKPGVGSELAFLSIRYKAPGATTSRLLERPIGDRDAFPSLQAAPESTRFALAVAGFAQRLRGDPWVAQADSPKAAAALADSSREYDPGGLKAEFAGMVRSSVPLLSPAG